MNRIRVAVVDDEEAVREAMAALVASDPELEVAGTASDTDEAVDMVRAQLPDVVLLDVRMPGGGGIVAARRIRSRFPATRVIAVTAHEDRTTVFEMLRAGAVGYVVKGGPGEEILEAVHRACLGQGTLSPEVSSDVVSELTSRLDEQADREAARRGQVERVRRLLREPGELTVVYQPIGDLTNGHTVAVEALARFPRTPGLGPTEWFRDAHRAGLGYELEVAALRLALAAERPTDVELAVNVSPQTIINGELPRLLEEGGGGKIIFEVTEHARVPDYAVLQHALDPLRAAGARVSIDDAGAGFASLRHILLLDPDIIKLDISLTRGIDNDRARRALAAALISFAQEIDAAIIAEGIETEGELLSLRELGVKFGQGYFLGRPAPLRDLALAI
jgi:EAL domain-containing protein (putative c-di-GMP-specific phosphodiesterase class I)/AmiR/NasT family two-component response regulator